jgi:hypothetical protein
MKKISTVAKGASKRPNSPKDAQEFSPRSRFPRSAILQNVFCTPSRWNAEAIRIAIT